MRSLCLVLVSLTSCAARTDDESLQDLELDESAQASAELADEQGDIPMAWNQSAMEKMVLVHPGDTDEAELVKTLSVATSENAAARRVVMRLGLGELPDLAQGDALITPAEVQVTTRCDVLQTAPGCNYNPTIRAQLILTGVRDDTHADGAQSKALSAIQTQSCTRAEHHCRFVFPSGESTQDLVGGFDLPCVDDGSCYVNLVMWAWHHDARSGGQDKVLVGENEGDYLANGVVKGDKGRLMVIRERGIHAADRANRETTGGGSIVVPTTTQPVVIYSHRLKQGGLAKNEQFLVEAKIVTEVADRARFSTLMFLTKDPSDKSGHGLDKTFPTKIGEGNGINCTSGTSPCTTRKVAVFRVTDDIAGPVYVNVIAQSAVPGGGSTQVTVKRNDGWIRSTRYQAEHKD